MSGQVEVDGRESPGGILAAVRAERGLSVDDVARAINVRATVLRAIENDDFVLCGGQVYARGHLRAYAKHVGADEAQVLDAYGALRQRSGSTAAAGRADQQAHRRPVAPPVPPLRGRRGRRGGDDPPLETRGPNWVLIAAGALVLVLVVLVAQLVNDLSGPGRGTSEVAAPSRTGAASASSAPATPTTSPSPAPATTPASSATATGGSTPSDTPVSPDAVAVALSFTGDSWVSVRDAAGRTMFSGLLGKGDSRQFNGRNSLRLTLGNAGAVRLTVNGKDIGSAGDRGQVVRLRFGPGDPA